MIEHFIVESIDDNARAGILKTSRGYVETPVFMPVGTLASVKSLDPFDLNELGASIILSNTYHLYLRPGIDVIDGYGGLHKFMSWNKPILTDSGGFQGFSLERFRKIIKDGIQFKSHIDGSIHVFTPENVINHQEKLGSNIMMPIDVCVAPTDDEQDVLDALELTTKWAARSLKAKTTSENMLFGIVQGGLFESLRRRSAEQLLEMEFDGYSIGGLSVGESKIDMYKIVDYTTQILPDNLPRYLMGVGSPEDLVECVARGIDMFDCVLPTRIARNGALFVDSGRVNITNSKYRKCDLPIEQNCKCHTCTNFSTGYLNHLFKTKELLGYRLATIHNLHFLMKLMNNIRTSIIENDFKNFREDFIGRFIPPDESTRRKQKELWLSSH